MSGSEGERPIIIIKKKVAGGHGHHGGSWKVAIADLMTAMMALFMVLWLIAQSPETRASVGAYFRDPLGLAGGGNTDTNAGPRAGGASFFDGGTTAISEDLVISPGNPRNSESAMSDKRLSDLMTSRDRLAQALMKLRDEPWARHVEMTVAEEGLRIEVQDGTDMSLFQSGNAKLRASGTEVLEVIATELGSIPNHVVVEGHTDASPASGKQTNWELSAGRANAARRFLVEHGLNPKQIEEVRGYADRHPRLWHDPTHPRNRRISILVMLRRERPGAPPSAPPPTPHQLDEKLRELDHAPTDDDPLELTPGGTRLPALPDH